MRISDWSSDVCSSDLIGARVIALARNRFVELLMRYSPVAMALALGFACVSSGVLAQKPDSQINPLSVSLARAGEAALAAKNYQGAIDRLESRSEEHTSELQSLMRSTYAVFCLKTKKTKTLYHHTQT